MTHTATHAGLVAGFKAFELGQCAQVKAGLSRLCTRSNTDGSWRVVQDGKTMAGGFDNEREALAWIKEMTQDDD